MRAPPRRHHIMLGQQLLRPARRRHHPRQLDTRESHRLRRLSRSFRTNDLLSNTHNKERNKTMTNQGNVSSPESAWGHGFQKGKEHWGRQLQSERLWSERLERFISKNGLELPDRDLGILARIGSFFARRWRSMLTVVLITLTLALLAIALWPHFHDGDLHLHWRNPFEALANYR